MAIVFIMFGFVNTRAQTFPVQASVQLTPPYSPYLADYIAPGSQKLFVQLLTNDVSIIDHPIKLRITIEGVGITLRTKQNFNPTQQLILFGGGAPTIFYGEDIAEYFNPDNLDFAGISRKDFGKTGKLPEGIYRFSIEVFSFNRNVIISNKAVTMAWVILNDPPLLNLPRKDVKVRIMDPTNIAFTWTPRHTGSPNAAFTTEYIFRLVEIWPANRNPYDAFLSQVPLYEATTDQTQIVYGPAEPAMIPGRSYAWQVQAKDAESRDVFKNDGRSEVYVFQFGDALSAPENIAQDGGNAATVNLSWDSPSQGEMPQSYRVRYRKKGAGNDVAWYESVTSQRWITLSDLQSNATYDIQIRSEAKPQLSEYSQLFSAQTTEVTASPYTCGLQIAIPQPTSVSPLLMLKVGDVITCSKFKVYVTEVKGTTGVFSGKGSMPVPFLNMATVNVAFSGIKVNSNYELVAGEIITTFNPGSDMAKVIDDANKIGEQPATKQNKTDSTKVDAPLEYKIDGTIDSVFVDSNGDIVVLDEEGKKTSYKQPVDSTTQTKKPIVISDSSGNSYLVQQDPVTKETTVTKMGGSPNSSDIVDASKLDAFGKLLRTLVLEIRSTDSLRIVSIADSLNSSVKVQADFFAKASNVANGAALSTTSIRTDFETSEALSNVELTSMKSDDNMKGLMAAIETESDQVLRVQQNWERIKVESDYLTQANFNAFSESIKKKLVEQNIDVNDLDKIRPSMSEAVNARIETDIKQ
jgi:hypothetical protein